MLKRFYPLYMQSRASHKTFDTAHICFGIFCCPCVRILYAVPVLVVRRRWQIQPEDGKGSAVQEKAEQAIWMAVYYSGSDPVLCDV